WFRPAGLGGGPRRGRPGAGAGGLAPGPQQRRVVPAAGPGRGGRRAPRRRGRPLRPARVQRPAAAGAAGSISEVELHCVEARLHGSELSKARRGELRLRLPVGFVHGKDGRVELDPDEEVRGALRAVFAAFERLGSACAVLRFFKDHGLKIPRSRWAAGEPHAVYWAAPSYQAIYHILANPVYPGAYHHGQRGRDRDAPASSVRPGAGRRRHALQETAVLLPEHHVGYLTWERFLANGRE